MRTNSAKTVGTIRSSHPQIQTPNTQHTSKLGKTEKKPKSPRLHQSINQSINQSESANTKQFNSKQTKQNTKQLSRKWAPQLLHYAFA
jgi:hypothetical protein